MSLTQHRSEAPVVSKPIQAMNSIEGQMGSGKCRMQIACFIFVSRWSCLA